MTGGYPIGCGLIFTADNQSFFNMTSAFNEMTGV